MKAISEKDFCLLEYIDQGLKKRLGKLKTWKILLKLGGKQLVTQKRLLIPIFSYKIQIIICDTYEELSEFIPDNIQGFVSGITVLLFFILL